MKDSYHLVATPGIFMEQIIGVLFSPNTVTKFNYAMTRLNVT